MLERLELNAASLEDADGVGSCLSTGLGRLACSREAAQKIMPCMLLHRLPPGN